MSESIIPNAIDNCCRHCVPPERHPGCRTDCPRWKAHEERKKVIYAQRDKMRKENEATAEGCRRMAKCRPTVSEPEIRRQRRNRK